LAAIELDDKSHDRQDRQDRDRFLNELFAASRIKLLRIKAHKSYDTRELARKITEAIRPT
jgi:very-short-patch-repair endonuclease